MNTKTTYDYETYHYRFDGCDVAPHCLNCPLPKCKYDDRTWYDRWKMKQKAQKLNAFQALQVPEIARALGISERTVHRWRGLELANGA